MKKLLMTIAMTLAVSNAFADDFTKSIDSTGNKYKKLGFVKVKDLINGGWIAINTSHILGYFKDGSSLSICLRKYLENTGNCIYIDENIRDLDDTLGFYSEKEDDNSYNPIETSGNNVNYLGFLYLTKTTYGDDFMISAKNIVYYSGNSTSTKVCSLNKYIDVYRHGCRDVNIDVEQFNQLFGFDGDYDSDTSKIKYSGNKINKTGILRFNSTDRSDSDIRINSEYITNYNVSNMQFYSINKWTHEDGSHNMKNKLIYSGLALKLVNKYFGFIDQEQ